MDRSYRFIIQNTHTGQLALFVEPYGSLVHLAAGEEVEVSSQFDNDDPVILGVSLREDGLPTVVVWPGHESTRVRREGRDVLE